MAHGMAWRTFLLMAPFLALQWFSSYYVWTWRWRGLPIHWNQIQIIVLFVMTVMWIMISPSRSWQDRLAGTVVVPK